MYQKKKTKEKEPESYARGFGYALFLLNLRMRSIEELRVKMNDRGFATQVITDVIAELLHLKYLNDTLMAESLVESYKQYRGYGYMKIKFKLQEKKLPKDLIQTILEEKLSEEEELKVAKKVLQKLPKAEIGDSKAKQKVIRSLASRGFRSSVIFRIIK